MVKILGDGDIDAASLRLAGFIDNDIDFSIWLNAMWARVGGDLFLQLWDLEEFRSMIFNFIRREHLIDNDELFLKWWNEALLRPNSRKARLKTLVKDSISSINRAEDRILSEEELHRALMEDPLLKTMIRTCNESEDLGPLIEETIREALSTHSLFISI